MDIPSGPHFLTYPQLLFLSGFQAMYQPTEHAADSETPPLPSCLIPFYLPDGTQQTFAVYRHQAVLLILQFQQPIADTAAYFERLRAFIRPRVSPIHQTLEEWMDKRASIVSIEDSFRFLYFNSMNLATKSNLSIFQLPRETLRVLNQMHRDFTEKPDMVTERVVQTRKYQWVVAKSSDQRFLYMIIDGPAESIFNIGQVDDHVQRLTSTVFGNIWW